MINEFISSIADNLKSIFPKKRVCIGELTQNCDGKLFIIVSNSAQKKCLGGLRKRSVSFDISYVCSDNDNLDYYKWIEKMYGKFEYIIADNARYRTQNLHGEKYGKVYHLLFDLDYWVYAKEDIPKMESLKQKGGVKNG